MSEDGYHPSSDKKTEERSPILSEVLRFVPLLAVIIQAIEFILKLLGIIR